MKTAERCGKVLLERWYAIHNVPGQSWDDLSPASKKMWEDLAVTVIVEYESLRNRNGT